MLFVFASDSFATVLLAKPYFIDSKRMLNFVSLSTGMPQDTYNIWFPHNYQFTQTICILQGLLSETSTNATVLTIASFTIERYIAICYPFRFEQQLNLYQVFFFSAFVLFNLCHHFEILTM